MAFFQVESLSMSFGGLDALSDIHFEVEKGSVFAIIGPNGAGKTTLFNCINGIYKPTRGRVFFKDREIQGKETRPCGQAGNCQNFPEY